MQTSTQIETFRAIKAMQETPGAHAEWVRVYDATGDGKAANDAVLAFAEDR